MERNKQKYKPEIQLRLILLIALMALINGCSQSQSTVVFQVNYEANYELPQGLGINFIQESGPDTLEVNLNGIFEANRTEPDLIRIAEIDFVELEIKSPADGNFDFLGSAQVYIKSTGLDEVLIAELNQVPENSSTRISLIPNSNNLFRYLQVENLEITLKTVSDQFLNSAHELRLRCGLRVEAAANSL